MKCPVCGGCGKEKPILFSTPMVQAILAGRKTMTRRVIALPCGMSGHPVGEANNPDNPLGFMYPGGIKRPRALPGDTLWVRETWFREECAQDCAGQQDENECPFNRVGNSCYGYKAQYTDPSIVAKWRPSIFMPREAARIFLRVTDVRAERLQTILCGDMKREGCIPATVTGGQYQQWQRDYWIPLWDGINAKRGYGWDENPWVWVYAFEHITEQCHGTGTIDTPDIIEGCNGVVKGYKEDGDA